mmetsp:Transcript_9622/g.34151  ORF Transcript_9622/g.34151 Transcript_9622/m.34151 type:complete len:471 (-) Transcript_9622:483-1895(-)
MIHTHRLCHTRDLVNILDVVEDVWILSHHFPVGFEVHDVHFIETNESHEEPQIGFGKSVATQEPTTRQDFFTPIKRVEQFIKCFFIRFLSRCKSTAIDTIVDGGVGPRIDGIDLLPEFFWIEVDSWFFCKFVELRIEHADDVFRFVVHDRIFNRAPQQRDSVLGCFVCHFLVQGTYGGSVTKLVSTWSEHPSHVLVLWIIRFGFLPGRFSHRHVDAIFQSFDGQHGQASAGPWTSQGHIQMVPSRRGFEPSTLGRHAVSKRGRRPVECTFGVCFGQSGLGTCCAHVGMDNQAAQLVLVDAKRRSSRALPRKRSDAHFPNRFKTSLSAFERACDAEGAAKRIETCVGRRGGWLRHVSSSNRQRRIEGDPQRIFRFLRFEKGDPRRWTEVHGELAQAWDWLGVLVWNGGRGAHPDACTLASAENKTSNLTQNSHCKIRLRFLTGSFFASSFFSKSLRSLALYSSNDPSNTST